VKTLKRAYFSRPIHHLNKVSQEHVLGELVASHEHQLEELQRNAWIAQIDHLWSVLPDLSSGHLFIEFIIPRMGKRADAIVLFGGVVFVIEYKIGTDRYESQALDQVLDYALDLKSFHETSHELPIVPVLVATGAPSVDEEISWDDDGIAKPVKSNGESLSDLIKSATTLSRPELDAEVWEAGSYKPTPTIVEAARALYAGHDVSEIARSDSGAINLTQTSDAVTRLAIKAHTDRLKMICFVTGVPGSGKTLAGLNLATKKVLPGIEIPAVYLSGNGPLVDVLREALSRDEVKREKLEGNRILKKEALRKAGTFIQNIHHFRDDGLRDPAPPVERIVIFDEAQRAWTREKLAAWMKDRKGVLDFQMSEPEYLLSVMDRHTDWCVVVCLIGDGQEIHTGEAGISEWFDAIKAKYGHWKVAVSGDLLEPGQISSFGIHAEEEPALHLHTSIRSFRSEQVSSFVGRLIDGDSPGAKGIMPELNRYPIALTRDIDSAKMWLREKARGTERIGLVASANALRLRTCGIYVKAKIDPKNWFLNQKGDVRSSFALEEVATEFDIQGLELDWVGVCWGADFRFVDDSWSHHAFRGASWNTIHSLSNKRYLANAYRVLLTRARQGMVIFIPQGSSLDPTVDPQFYDSTYKFLIQCGVDEII